MAFRRQLFSQKDFIEYVLLDSKYASVTLIQINNSLLQLQLIFFRLAICGGKITDTSGTINSPPESVNKGYCVWLFSNTFEQKFDLDIIDLKLINPPSKCRDSLAIETENGFVRTFCENQPRTKISVAGKKIEIKLASHNPQSSFKLNYKLGE